MTALRITSLVVATVLGGAALTVSPTLNGLGAQAVPPAVLAAEALAEDIQADLDTGAWQPARVKLGQLQANRAPLRAAAAGRDLVGYETALDSLTARVRRLDRLASL